MAQARHPGLRSFLATERTGLREVNSMLEGAARRPIRFYVLQIVVDYFDGGRVSVSTRYLRPQALDDDVAAAHADVDGLLEGRGGGRLHAGLNEYLGWKRAEFAEVNAALATGAAKRGKVFRAFRKYVLQAMVDDQAGDVDFVTRYVRRSHVAVDVRDIHRDLDRIVSRSVPGGR